MDDCPVGGGAGSQPFEDVAAAVDDFKGCSVMELVAHSNWKARKEGYDRIQSDPSQYKKILLESRKAIAGEGNSTVQEAAIGALVAVLPSCSDEECSQLADGTLTFVVEKGITGRPKAAQASSEFASALVEEGKANAVFAALLPSFAHRTPKNRLAATQLASGLIADYGVQHFPLKEVLKGMQPLFNDANPQVRKEAATLCCQCYRYIGASIRGFLTDLREVQLLELQKQFEDVQVGEAAPKRIKGDVAEVANGKTYEDSLSSPKALSSLTGEGNGAVVDDAAFELLGESAVIAKLPKKFFRAAMDKEAPWQERVEYINQRLMPLLAAPRLRADEDYHELANMMKEYLVDPQAPLMLLGFKMIQECACGLRGAFSAYARLYVPLLLEKMKDKKTSVQLHLMKTLESLICFHCISLDQCTDDIDFALQSKNPTQRTVIANFCIRMVDILGDKSQYAKLGRSTTMLTRLVNDEKSSIRDVAYVLLEKLMQAFGEVQFRSVLSTLDDNQRNNMAVAVARANGGGAPRAQPSSSTSNLPTPHRPGAIGVTPFNSPAKKLARVDTETTSLSSASAPSVPVRPTSTSKTTLSARQRGATTGDKGDAAGRHSLVPRPSTTTTTTSIASPSSRASLSGRAALPRSRAPSGTFREMDFCSASKGSTESGISLESSLPPTMEAATTILGMLNGDTTVADLVRSTDWSRRQEGMGKLHAMVQEWTPAQAARGLDHLVVFVRAHPSFREPIVQIVRLIAEMFQTALEKVPTPSYAAGYVLVSGATPRIADSKMKPLAFMICKSVTAKLGARFVVRHMLDTAAVVKLPKLSQQVCEYVRGVVQAQPDCEEADGEAVELRGVLQFIRSVCADANNALVRQEAALLLVDLRRTPRGAAAIERCVATLPPPMPAMYERELRRTESPSALRSPAVAEPPLPPKGPASRTPSTTGGPTSPPVKRVRTSSMSPAPGGSATPARTSSPPRASPAYRRALSGSLLHSPHKHVDPAAGAGSAFRGTSARLSSGRNGSFAGTGRSSTTAAAASAPPPSLRLILQHLTAGEDWRDRLGGLRRAEEYVEEQPRPLPAVSAAALLKALQGRFEEANTNVVVEVLRFIPVVVAAAGEEECNKPLRQLAPGVLAMLGHQKTALREEARNIAFLVMRVAGLEAMLPLLPKPLTSESNICRQNALEVMMNGFEQLPADATLPRVGLQLLTPTILTSMMDRILEVRLLAEQVLGWMVGVVGEEWVLQCVEKLKPAEQQVVRPAIDRQLEHHRLHHVQEGTPEPGRRASPSLSRQLSGPAYSFHEEGDSRRSTPRMSTPRSGAAGGAPRASNNLDASHRRLSLSFVSHGVAATPPTSTLIRPHAVPNPPPTTSDLSPLAPMRLPEPLAVERELSAKPTTQPVVQAAVSKMKPAVPTTVKTTSTAARQSGGTTGSAVAKEEELYTIQDILVGLRSATPEEVRTMCGDFKRQLRSGVDCGSPEVLQAMVDRLYENTQNFNVDLAQALIDALTDMFMNPRSAARCHRQLLTRIVGTFFDCLLCERFSLAEPVIKALNMMTLRMLEGCNADDVFSALLSRLTNYSGAYLVTGHRSDFKYVQVTVKCVMRVDLARVSADNTVLCCHEFLLQHPPSAFRNLDDMPIRTVKTILQGATKRHGPSLLGTAEKLVGPQNLVTHFIRACLDLQDTASKDKDLNEQQAIEESRHELRASQSPPPKTAAEMAGSASTTATGSPRPPTTPSKATTPRRATGAVQTPVSQMSTASTPRKRRLGASTETHVTVKAAPPMNKIPLARNSNSGAATPSTLRLKSPRMVTSARRTPLKRHPDGQQSPTRNHDERRGSATAASSQQPTPTLITPSSSATADSTATTLTSSVNAVSETKKELTDIFAHIRNHVTSAAGIDELYGFMKENPSSMYEQDFNLQFNRCSEAFRLYIKRKLERKLEDDTAKSSVLQLPSVIQSIL